MAVGAERQVIEAELEKNAEKGKAAERLLGDAEQSFRRGSFCSASRSKALWEL